MLVIPAFRKQKNFRKMEASLGYTVRFRFKN